MWKGFEIGILTHQCKLGDYFFRKDKKLFLMCPTYELNSKLNLQLRRKNGEKSSLYIQGCVGIKTDFWLFNVQFLFIVMALHNSLRFCSLSRLTPGCALTNSLSWLFPAFLWSYWLHYIQFLSKFSRPLSSFQLFLSGLSRSNCFDSIFLKTSPLLTYPFHGIFSIFP